MNWRLALTALGLIAAMPVTVAWATTALPPLTGLALALCLYWLALTLILWRSLDAAALTALTQWRRPARLLTFFGFLPVVVMAWIALGSLGERILPPWALPLIAVAALVHGLLSELFWRGVLLPRPDREGVLTTWGLFALWHLGLAFAQGIVLPGGPFGPLLAAAVMGGVWSAMRVQTASIGAGLAGHVALALFAMIVITAGNWPG